MWDRDHLISDLTKDEYYLYIYEVLNDYWPSVSANHFYLVKAYNVCKDGVIQDCLVKLLKRRKDGLTYYEKACKEGWTIGAIKSFSHLTLTSVVLDIGKRRSVTSTGLLNMDLLFTDDDYDIECPKQLETCDDYSYLQIEELLDNISAEDVRSTVKDTIKYIIEGSTLKEACKRVGISVARFNSIIRKNKINIADYI